MDRKFLLVTDDDMNCKLAQGIKGKETELMHYDFEYDLHQATIDTLGDIVWDETTEEYRGLDRNAIAARAVRKGLTPEQIAHLYALKELEDAHIGRAIVDAERTKVQRHYDNFCCKLPEGPVREAAFAAIADPVQENQSVLKLAQ